MARQVPSVGHISVPQAQQIRRASASAQALPQALDKAPGQMPRQASRQTLRMASRRAGCPVGEWALRQALRTPPRLAARDVVRRVLGAAMLLMLLAALGEGMWAVPCLVALNVGRPAGGRAPRQASPGARHVVRLSARLRALWPVALPTTQLAVLR
jgi:hypothetical protein